MWKNIEKKGIATHTRTLELGYLTVPNRNGKIETLITQKEENVLCKETFI